MFYPCIRRSGYQALACGYREKNIRGCTEFFACTKGLQSTVNIVTIMLSQGLNTFAFFENIFVFLSFDG
jgi:hypothetical protein